MNTPGTFYESADRYKFCCWIFHVKTGARLVYLLSLIAFCLQLYFVILEHGLPELAVSIVVLVIKLIDVCFFLAANIKLNENYMKVCLFIWLIRTFAVIGFLVYYVIIRIPKPTELSVIGFIIAFLLIIGFNIWIVYILFKYYRYLKEKNTAIPIFGQGEHLMTNETA